MHEQRIAEIVADQKRVELLVRMRDRDLSAHDIASELALPASAASYQIKQMVRAGLLYGNRSDHDARVVYYRLDAAALARYITALQRKFGLLPEDKNASPALILYVCRANSVRSQMAAAWSRRILPTQIAVASCGIEVRPIHPMTIIAMAEVGIDLTLAATTQLAAVTVAPTMVVSVCDSARQTAGASFTHVEHLHWSIPDPALHADLDVFRQTREIIRQRVTGLGTRF